MPDATPLPSFSPRPTDAHKASVGRVLVVGGSVGMSGAPTLCARAALRAGAGLVTIAVPERIRDVVASMLPEAMTIALPCEADDRLAASAADIVLAHLDRVNALVVGPGLGRAPGTDAAVLRIVGEARKPLVLDADGLYVYRGNIAALAKRSAPTILTPHEGEASSLLGARGEAALDREARAALIAREGNAVCVLKGPGTVVADARRTRVNSTGGPILSTGGTGDVLAGVIGAFLAGLPATGADAFGAASLAVHVHGAAGDRLAATRGDRGTLASEIADAIPEVIRHLVREGLAR